MLYTITGNEHTITAELNEDITPIQITDYLINVGLLPKTLASQPEYTINGDKIEIVIYDNNYFENAHYELQLDDDPELEHAYASHWELGCQYSQVTNAGYQFAYEVFKDYPSGTIKRISEWQALGFDVYEHGMTIGNYDEAGYLMIEDHMGAMTSPFYNYGNSIHFINTAVQLEAKVVVPPPPFNVNYYLNGELIQTIVSDTEDYDTSFEHSKTFVTLSQYHYFTEDYEVKSIYEDPNSSLPTAINIYLNSIEETRTITYKEIKEGIDNTLKTETKPLSEVQSLYNYDAKELFALNIGLVPEEGYSFKNYKSEQDEYGNLILSRECYKLEVKTDLPIITNDNIINSQHSNISTKTISRDSNGVKNSLPETGESSMSYLLAIGAIVLLFVVLLVIKKMQKNR